MEKRSIQERWLQNVDGLIVKPEEAWNAHHIKTWAHYPGLRFDPNNGITLQTTPQTNPRYGRRL